MKHQQYAAAAIFILALTSILWLIWMYSCQPQKQQSTNEKITQRTDSVAAVSISQPDSAKLRKVNALKQRIAKAKVDRLLDSLDRAKSNRP